MLGFEPAEIGQAAALLFAAVLIVLTRTGRYSFRSRRSGRAYRSSSFAGRKNYDIADVGQQLHAVMAAPFQKRRLLSRSEYQAFRIIEEDVAAARKGYRVFAQTSLGEILASPDADAFRSINSKRVDILIVDAGGWPVAAIEYQGEGHYQGAAAGRDAVKKEALRKAGVRYIEVSVADSAEQIRYRVREQLGWAAASAL